MVSVNPAAAGDFPDFQPPSGADVFFHFRISINGILRLYRVDAAGAAALYVPAIVVVASDVELTFSVSDPLFGRLRWSFENTDVDPGTVTVDVGY